MENRQRSGTGSAGDAVAGMTPPEIKRSGAASAHPSGAEPGSGGARSGGARSGGTVGTHDPQTASTSSTDVVSGPLQNLLAENLLLAAPRTTFNGHECPCLGGIPLLRKLGQGGMGAVYYGIHMRLHIEVAVKVLPYHLVEKDPLLVERFFREAQISAQVRSPHLVNVMDVNEESGVFFLVMEYVNGMSGKDRLAVVTRTGAKGMTELEALQICVAACTGLEDAHARGIIHRDIKPENIMIPYVSKTSKELNVDAAKLMDLGLARADSGTINNPALTATKQAMGTPGYMAPEQIMDARTAGPASDVFSMGATLYAMLAGQAPFKRKNAMQTLMATMNAPHTPVIQERPDVSEEVSHIIDNCLAKEIGNRYPDGHHLLIELKRALKHARAAQGQPVHWNESTPGDAKQHPGEGGELPVLPAEDVQEATPPPKKAPAKKIPVKLYVAAGAAIVVLSAAVYLLWPSDDKTLLVLHERSLKKALTQIAANPEKARETVQDTSEVLKFKDPAPRQRETAVLSLIEVHQGLKSAKPNFSELDEKLKLAEKWYADNPLVLASRKDLDKRRQDQNDYEILKRIADVFETTFLSKQNLTQDEMSTARARLTALETQNEKLKNPELVEQLKKMRTRIDALDKDFVKKRVDDFAAVDAAMTDPAIDSATAERRLVDLERLYPRQPDLPTLRARLAEKKNAERDTRIQAAGALIDNPASKVFDLERSVEELEKKYPGDKQVENLRHKLVKRTGEEAERQRVAKVKPALDAYDAAVNAAVPDLLSAEAALKRASQDGARPAELDPRRLKLDELQATARRNRAFADAERDLADRTTDIDAVKKALEALKTSYPTDERVAALYQSLAKREQAVKDDRIRKISVPMIAVRTAIANKHSDLITAQRNMDEARRLGATDEELAPLQKQLNDEIKAREKYASDFRKIEDMFTSAATADIKNAFTLLEASYPGDAKLKEIAARIVEREKTDALAAEAERKKRIKPFTEAAGTLLASGKDTDLSAASEKLREARAAGATEEEVGPLYKTLAHLTQRRDDLKSLNDVLSSKTATIEEIDAQFTKFSSAYKGDGELDALKDRIETRRKEIEAKREEVRRTNVKYYVELADKLILPDADLSEAKKNIDEAQKANATELELSAVKKKLAAEETRRERVRLTNEARKLIEGPTSELSAADIALIEDKLKTLELRFKDDSEVSKVRVAFTTRRGNEEAARKKLNEIEQNRKREEAKRESFNGLIASTKTSLGAKNFALAEEQLNKAAVLYDKDPALDPLRKELETGKTRQKFDGLIASASTSIKNKNVVQAKSQVDEAAALQPTDAQIPALREEIKKLEALLAAPAVDPNRVAFDSLINSANASIQKKDKEGAQDSAKKAAQLFPNDPRLREVTERISKMDDVSNEVPGKRVTAQPQQPQPQPQPIRKKRRIGEEDPE